MKFNVIKTSDDKFYELRDFQSLEELMKFVEENDGYAVIGIADTWRYDNDYYTLEIYDDYRE